MVCYPVCRTRLSTVAMMALCRQGWLACWLEKSRACFCMALGSGSCCLYVRVRKSTQDNDVKAQDAGRNGQRICKPNGRDWLQQVQGGLGPRSRFAFRCWWYSRDAGAEVVTYNSRSLYSPLPFANVKCGDKCVDNSKVEQGKVSDVLPVFFNCNLAASSFK